MSTMPTTESKVTAQERWQQFVQASKAIREAFRPYVAGYKALLRRLRQEGFRVRQTSLVAPVQLEGRLPTGERFYFRCRGTTCSLSIAPARQDPVREPAWEQEVSRWEWPAAGSLEAEEAEAVFRELLAAYVGSKTEVA